MMTHRTAAAEIAAATYNDAYSRDRYTPAEWVRCAQLLAERGFTAREIEWVLLSKWMRWSADAGNAAHDATAEMLGAFLDDRRNRATRRAVQTELTR